MAFITAETRSDLIALSVGMLKQAPSNALLEELIALSVDGGTLADAADHIAKTAAFKAEYPSFQTAAQYAAEIFDNITTGGTVTAEIRTAVIDLATGYLTSGAYSKAGLALAIVDFLSQPAALLNSDFADIAQSVQNRSAAAEYFVVTKELGGSTDAELAAAVASVTSDAATLTAANAAADTTAAAVAVVPGQTFTLTTGLDNKTLGAGADQAFATDSTTAADDTFNVSDLVTGGAGEDTFFLTVDSLATATTYAPSRITGFEKLSVTNIDATPDALTVNTNLMGLSSVEVSASTADVLFTNVTAGSAVSLLGNTSDVTVTMKNAGLTGATDSATLAVTGNTGAVVIDSDGVADIELATITATGTNSGALTIGDNSGASTVTALTVLGTGSYDLESAGSTIDDELKTLDASANSGGVTFTTTIATDSALTGGSGNDVLTGGAGNDVIKGGAGDDTLAMGSGGKDHLSGGAGNDTITATGATKDDTISGGDGVDTLLIGSALAYDDEAEPTAINNAANISGFEVLATSAALTQNMTPLTGVVAVSAAAGVATITKASGIADFYATADSTGLDMTLATDGTEDSLNIHVGSDKNQTNSTGVTVDAIEVETALIASLGADSNTVTDFEADALTKLSVIGKKSISITLNDSAAVATIPLTEVDASGFSGSSLTITAQEADSGVTVTTGSEALTVTVGDGANSITGTAGDDSVTTGKGADTISVGEGDNTVSAGDGANTITAGDGGNTITDGEGVGTITVGAGDNTITLGDGADVVVAGAGDNTITNAAGNATITSGDGESTVTNTSGNSTITLGDGGNTVNLTAGNSTVVTGSGADDINITAGNNNITAGAGNDTISLGSGNDTVDAGTGTDAVDFSVSSGTWTGSISDAETITGTFGGSATIDFDGISDYDTVSITAKDTATSATVKNVSSATISLTDDSVEAGGDGDIVDLTIDTVADAVISLTVGANQEAAVAANADLESLTLTDASSLSITSAGGALTNVLDHDLEAVALDDDETTSLSVTAGSYTGIETGNITGTDSLESVTLTASGAEADLVVEDIEDATNLSSLSITASGLNSAADVSEVGGTDSAILNTLTLTASNAGTVTMNGDLITAENMTSLSMTSSGEGSSIVAQQISADGLDVESMTISASDEASVDIEANSANIINFLPDTLTISTSGTGSTVDADVLTFDAGALTTTESSISISAQGASSVVSLDDSELGGAEVDLVSLVVGEYATLNLSGSGVDNDGGDGEGDGVSDSASTIIATSDIGTLTIQVDDYGTLSTAETDIGAEASATSDVLTIEGDYIGTFNLTIAENATWDAGTVLTIGTDSEAAVGIEYLNINLEDMGNETDVILGAEGLVDIGGTDYISIGDAEGEESTYYAGSIVLQGDEDNVITVGADALEADLIQSTAGTDGVFGSWTLTTGSGADAVTGGSGADTINVGAGADTVDGGAGNDVITAGNGADEITIGAGKDTVNLTETVSAADQVILTAELQGSAAGTDEGTFTNYNVITGFDTLVDHINHDDASFAGGALTFVIANTAATAAASDLAAANFADVDSVLAFLNDAEVEDTIAADSADYAAAEDILVAVTLGNGTTAIYEIIGATAGTLVAADIALLGTVDTTMVIGDFM